MVAEDEITVAKRYYGDDEGFNRVQNEDSNINE